MFLQSRLRGRRACEMHGMRCRQKHRWQGGAWSAWRANTTTCKRLRRSDCEGCGTGKYINATSATACVACGANAASTADGRACACQAGLEGDGQVGCTACAAGKARDNLATSVICSGSCPCEPSSGERSGNIADGPGSYGNGENCSWVVSATFNLGQITLRKLGERLATLPPGHRHTEGP